MFIRYAYGCYFCLLLGLIFRARTKMNGPVPRMGAQKSALHLFLFRLKTLSLSCKLLRPRCVGRAVCIIINNSLNVPYNGRTIYTQTLSEKT